MNKDEALSKLELEEGATSSDINTQYQEFYNEFQMRITNAPTEHQRKLYQKKLEELSEAFKVLGGENSESNTQELPGIAESEVVETEKYAHSFASINNNFESEKQSLINKAIPLPEALILLNVKETSSSDQIEKAYLTKKSELEKELHKAKIEAVKQVYRQEIEKLADIWLALEPWLQNRVNQDNFYSNPFKEKNEFVKFTNKKKYLIIGITLVAVFVISIIVIGGLQQGSANEKQLSKFSSEIELPFKTSKKYDEIRHFKDGMACVVLNEKLGFIDESGREVIPLIYEYNRRQCTDFLFASGLAPVILKGKCGYINKGGKLIIRNNYDWVMPFNEGGMAKVGIGDKNWVIDRKGNKQNLNPDDIEDRYYIINHDDYPEVEYFDNDKYGCFDKKGNIIIPPIYERIHSFYKGIAAVELNGKLGFIDAKGKQIVPFKYIYDEIFDWYGGLARVYMSGKGYGFVNDKGKEVIPCKYDEAEFFVDGLCPVAKDGKWGYIDKNGKVVIPLKFESAKTFAFNEQLALVKYKGRRYFIDKKGNLIIDCQ